MKLYGLIPLTCGTTYISRDNFWMSEILIVLLRLKLPSRFMSHTRLQRRLTSSKSAVATSTWRVNCPRGRRRRLIIGSDMRRRNWLKETRLVIKSSFYARRLCDYSDGGLAGVWTGTGAMPGLIHKAGLTMLVKVLIIHS